MKRASKSPDGGHSHVSDSRPWEQELLRFVPLALAIVLVGLSAAIRIATRSVVTSDLDFHILPWYTKLQKHGIFIGLGQDFYNYTPPYLYLLALATLTAPVLSAVAAVKLISTAFDAYAAFMIYKIVKLRWKEGYLPHLAAAAFFAAPTVIANSGIWGQADSTYTAFLLTCLYFVLVSRPVLAVVFFSVALAFKPQAVFLAPMLVVLILWNRLRWFHLLLVPVVYAVLMWPAVALGRTWIEVFTTYVSQAGSGKGLTHNAATLYVFVPKSEFDLFIRLGVVLAVGAVLAWVVYSWLGTRRRDRRVVLLLTLISVTLTPFFLPNMHDRYFYPADAISIALAFSAPAMWIIPFLFQLISGLSYSIYLLSASPDNLIAAALINVLTLVVLLRQQAAWGERGRQEAAGAPHLPENG
jgi:Gpi18-like mannosyltransferase